MQSWCWSRLLLCRKNPKNALLLDTPPSRLGMVTGDFETHSAIYDWLCPDKARVCGIGSQSHRSEGRILFYNRRSFTLFVVKYDLYI